MSLDSDIFWPLLSDENVKADLPFFAPLPQADAPPVESFESEFAELDFDGLVQLPVQDPFSTLRDSTPVFPSPSVLTHSTDYDHAPSEYSYVDYPPPSNYSMPLDTAFQGVRVSSDYGGVDTMHDHMYPSPFTGDLSSFGPLPPSPPASPPLRMGKAQSDYGPSKRHTHFAISPQSLSLPHQQTVTPSGLPALPGQAAPDTQSHSGPGRMHQCSNCSRAFARAFNLKTHMDTHNPERSKPFVCPHSSCKRSFSRKHDLQRHRTAIHRDQASSSVYSDSSRVSKIGVTTGTRAWCDKCGKGHVGREGGCECNDIK